MPTVILILASHEYDFARLDHWVLCPDCGAVGLSHRRVCGCHVFYYRQCGKSLNGHYQRNIDDQLHVYGAGSPLYASLVVPRCYHWR